jgi:Cytochrome P450
MNQDPEVYSEPQAFDPDRFTENDNDTTTVPDPKDVVFGFGRRICPGRQFADTNIWLAAASMVSTVNISKALDHNGHEITPAASFGASFARYAYFSYFRCCFVCVFLIDGVVISHPDPFECQIRPRSERMMDLVSRTKSLRVL